MLSEIQHTAQTTDLHVLDIDVSTKHQTTPDHTTALSRQQLHFQRPKRPATPAKAGRLIALPFKGLLTPLPSIPSKHAPAPSPAHTIRGDCDPSAHLRIELQRERTGNPSMRTSRVSEADPSAHREICARRTKSAEATEHGRQQRAHSTGARRGQMARAIRPSDVSSQQGRRRPTRTSNRRLENDELGGQIITRATRPQGWAAPETSSEDKSYGSEGHRPRP